MHYNNRQPKKNQMHRSVEFSPMIVTDKVTWENQV